jgi:hypothetical protein
VNAFGVRDTTSREPMPTNLYLRIGSVTKNFVNGSAPFACAHVGVCGECA